MSNLKPKVKDNLTASSKPKVILTSQSEIKLQAVKNVFSEYTYQIESYKTESGVPEQPLGFEEIEMGTMNRLKYVFDKHGAESDTIYISIENGLLNHMGSPYPGNHFYDIANIAVLYVPKNTNEVDLDKVISSWSAMVPVPKALYDQVPDDRSSTFTPGNNDPHQKICGVTREQILTQALEVVSGTLFG